MAFDKNVLKVRRIANVFLAILLVFLTQDTNAYTLGEVQSRGDVAASDTSLRNIAILNDENDYNSLEDVYDDDYSDEDYFYEDDEDYDSPENMVEEKFGESIEDYFEDDSEEDGDYFESEEEDENNDSIANNFYYEYVFVPAEGESIDLNRRRKRHIVVPIGKAVERSRGRNQGQKHWDTSSKAGGTYHQHHSSMPAVKEPMGTELLYREFPELAPASWRNRNMPIKPSSPPPSPPETKHVPISKKSIPLIKKSSTTTSIKKPKVKLTKKLKIEIAEFAQRAGIPETIKYFRMRLGRKLKEKAVRKFVARYQSREERRRNLSSKGLKRTITETLVNKSKRMFG